VTDTVTYAAAPVEVRADIVDLHQRIWAWLAQPGLWWSGAERIAIAAELRHARDCSLCAERKAALSPFATNDATDSAHDTVSDLPAAAIDAVHRIATDPGRLTESWYREILQGGVSDAAYVELVVVIACVVAVDTFARAVGVPTFELPIPEPGEPSRLRPDGAIQEGAWVPTIPLGGAGANEADLYYEGFVTNSYRAISLAAPQARMFFDIVAVYYVGRDHITDPTYSSRAISRAQIEVVAARISALNQCFF
jgi:alkylhydroperoxidase family enzyme